MGTKIVKVLLIATTNLEIDGITNVILNYYRAMDKTDMQIDFVAPNDLRDDLILEIESFGGHIYKIENRNRKPWLYSNRLTRLIKVNSYDIIHAHGNSCTLALEMYAAKKGGAKVRIPHVHNTNTKHKIINKMLKGVFNKLYTQAFACGQKAGEWLYNGKKFEVITNGININMYKYNEQIREEYRNNYHLNGKKVIGHIGHFAYSKNHEYLINIFAELFKLDNSYILMLIGDGKLKPDIEKKINELGLTTSVIFVGKTLDVPQLMQAIDFIVLPSRYEGLPLTLIEAQSACLPCFVSDVVTKEVAITDLVKFISLNKSSKEWADQINILAPIDRGKIECNIYKQIVEAGYSINDNAKKLKELYNSYINV